MISHKNIVVTCASIGIGKSIMEELLKQEGNRILAACRRAEAITGYGDNVIPFSCDLSTKEGVDALFKKAEEVFDEHIDLYFCNAGAPYYERFDYADWDRILSVATPARTATERELLPYAFLALGEKGRLGDELYRYPVRSRSDFDMSGLPEGYAHYFYNALLYGTLQGPNEAVHSAFQLATYQEHGQSFLVLRRLLADYYAMGNYALAKKYAAVLSRSTLHAQYVRHFTERMAAGTPREPDSVAFRKEVPLITRDPLSNLVKLGAGGINAPASLDRVLCSLLLDGDLESFRTVLASARDRYPVLPRYYQEALAGGL